MKTIYKYDLPISDEIIVEMPAGAQPVAVGPAITGVVMYVWAIVDPDAPTEDHTFFVRGTGHPLREVGRYIGTFKDGAFLIWHVFDEVKTAPGEIKVP